MMKNKKRFIYRVMKKKEWDDFKKKKRVYRKDIDLENRYINKSTKKQKKKKHKKKKKKIKK